MSEQKHTPGPWTVGEVGVYFREGISIMATEPCGGGAVATTTRRTIGESPAFADAHLIAAAPDLLEALKAHDTYMTAGGYAGPDDKALHPWAAENWRNVRAAIAKAEGR